MSTDGPLRCSEMSYVNDMLALVAFLIIWTSACWELTDADAVYVACCASHLDCFLWNFICTLSNAIDDEHSVNVSTVRGLSVELK